MAQCMHFVQSTWVQNLVSHLKERTQCDGVR